MPTRNRIAEFSDDMKAWRRDIHKHPELAFEEQRTSDLVADKLAGWGIEVHRGLARTGVVGVIDGQRPAPARAGGTGLRAIGLRADMDALPMAESNDFAHRSVYDGKMHACGHDGHTAILLGAARYLAETRNFAGRAVLIFQPAEESGGGAKVMMEEGLFDSFPVDEVYGLHNMPGLPAGHIAVRPGPMLASGIGFEITVTGQGSHAASPHLGRDTIVTACSLVGAIQTLRARRLGPMENAVISVTQFHAGDSHNILPETAELQGTLRCFRPEVQDQLCREMESLTKELCQAYGATGRVIFHAGYPPVINHPAQARVVAEVARQTVGEAAVVSDVEPVMGSEDFAYFLEEKPGSYLFLGNGADSGPSGCTLHNTHYDFNDDILATGAEFWVRLVESRLAPATAG